MPSRALVFVLVRDGREVRESYWLADLITYRRETGGRGQIRQRWDHHGASS